MTTAVTPPIPSPTEEAVWTGPIDPNQTLFPNALVTGPDAPLAHTAYDAGDPEIGVAVEPYKQMGWPDGTYKYGDSLKDLRETTPAEALTIGDQDQSGTDFGLT